MTTQHSDTGHDSHCMDDQATTPERYRPREPKLTVLVCWLVLIAFAHMTFVGINRQKDIHMYWGSPSVKLHGWPVPFAQRSVGSMPFEESETVLVPSPNAENSSGLSSFRITNVTAAVRDVFLSLILVAATGVVVRRLETRNWARLQFSIGDILSLTAMTGMVLGLIYLDDRFSLGGHCIVEGLYVRLRDLPLFDRVMVLIAIACAVWLVVSTVIERLGGKRTVGTSPDVAE